MRKTNSQLQTIERALAKMKIPDFKKILANRSWEEFYNWRLMLELTADTKNVKSTNVEIDRVDVVTRTHQGKSIGIEAKSVVPNWFSIRGKNPIYQEKIDRVNSDTMNLKKAEFDTRLQLIWFLTILIDTPSLDDKKYCIVENAKKKGEIGKLFFGDHESQKKAVRDIFSDQFDETLAFREPIHITSESNHDKIRLWGMLGTLK